MKKIKVLIVEPNMLPEVAEIDNDLETLQDIVGGYIEPVYPLNFTDDVVLICNDEGKLMQLPFNTFLFTENGVVYDFIAGTFIVARAPEDSEDFESLTDEQIVNYWNMF